MALLKLLEFLGLERKHVQRIKATVLTTIVNGKKLTPSPLKEYNRGLVIHALSVIFVPCPGT